MLSLLRFLKVEDKLGIVYSDNAPELEAAVKRLGVRRNTSHERVNRNKAVIEREIRTILEGTRSKLTQADLPNHVWSLAAQHHAMALNISQRWVWKGFLGRIASGNLLTICFRS